MLNNSEFVISQQMLDTQYSYCNSIIVLLTLFDLFFLCGVSSLFMCMIITILEDLDLFSNVLHIISNQTQFRTELFCPTCD